MPAAKRSSSLAHAIAHALGVMSRELRRAIDQRGSLRQRGILQRIPSHPANRTFAIEAMLRKGEASTGDTALLIAFGAGLSYAGQVVTLPPLG